jgi:hypothetical protein
MAPHGLLLDEANHDENTHSTEEPHLELALCMLGILQLRPQRGLLVA